MSNSVDVQLQRTGPPNHNAAQFSLLITGMAAAPIFIARSTPPEVGEIDLPLAYRLRLIQTLHLIQRAALPRRIVNRDSREAQSRYKHTCDKHVWFKIRFAAGDKIFIEGRPLMASAPDRVAFEGYSTLLP